MQTNTLSRVVIIHQPGGAIDQIFAKCAPSWPKLFGHPLVLEVVERLAQPALQAEVDAMLEGCSLANAMQPAQCAPEPQQMIKIIQLGCMSATTRKNGYQETLCLVECGALNRRWRHNRKAVINQLLSEGVLFQNLLAGPTLWPIELHDDRVSFFEAYLINPVFIAIQGE